MDEARIDVVIDPAQAQSGAAAARSAVDMVKNSFLELSAKVFVAQQAFEMVWRSAKAGAEFEETMGRLNRQMGTFNGTAQGMVTSMQSIANETISIDKAATMASRALAVGLNPDQIRIFTMAADSLEDVMGTDLPTAFDNIVQAAITGRSQMLANIGVYVDLDEEVKRLAVSTGRTTDQITKQERAMLAAKAITAQAGDALHKLSDGAVSDADKLKQVEARWQNLWITIGQGTKTAVIEAIDSLEALGKKLDSIGLTERVSERILKTLPQFTVDPFGTIMREVQARKFAQDPAVWQEVLGRAIVQDTQGNLDRPLNLRTEPPKPMPTALRGRVLDAERERQNAGIQGDLDRAKIGLDSLQRLYDLDAQRQMVTQEELVKMKGDLRVREIDEQRATLDRLLTLEQDFHDRRLKIGFDSTEERIDEDERYKGKVFEINEAILKNTADRGAAIQQNEAERGLARMQAESALGQRLADAARSAYDIQEAIRQRDLDDAQTYYQGQIDMANARFASDADIASRERALLREQLAFKLRISKEEAEQLLLLRKSGDVTGAGAILGTADPMLSGRAREGIMESFSARDTLLQERESGDFFAGWRRGLQRYTRDTQSAFGMAQDMARRTAQTMEQGFQQMFFDPMQQGYKGMLDNLLNMTKQIVSQIMAQLVTSQILQLLGVAGKGFGAGGTDISSFLRTGLPGRDVSAVNVGAMRFASGGSFTVGGTGGVDTTPVGFMATPGETVTVMPPGKGGVGVQVPISINVVNQMPGANVSAEQRPLPGGGQEISLLITKKVNEAMASGQLDRVMKSRWGLTPGER